MLSLSNRRSKGAGFPNCANGDLKLNAWLKCIISSLAHSSRSLLMLQHGAAVASYLMLQRREADKAQEKLSSWGHGHGGVHSCQAVCGPLQVLPQAQDSFSWRGLGQAQLVLVIRRRLWWSWLEVRRFPPTFVSLEKFEQSAYGSYGRGHVGVFSHLRPEVLHQLWAGTYGLLQQCCFRE